MMDFGSIMGLLLMVVFVWTVIQFINKKRSNNLHISDQQGLSENDENARDILNKRFASGEISQLEYERMKKKL